MVFFSWLLVKQPRIWLNRRDNLVLVIFIWQRWQLGQATHAAQMRVVKALPLTLNIQNMLFLCKEALGLQILLVCSSDLSSVSWSGEMI